MLYKLMVMLHMFGACVWIGGHVVLVGMVLPKAFREKNAQPIIDFERDYGKFGLVALIIQLVTGLWLARRWVGAWSSLFSEPTPQGHLVLSKLTLLIVTVVLAGYTYHRELPRIEQCGLKSFTVLSGLTATLAILMLVLGVGIRTGGLL